MLEHVSSYKYTYIYALNIFECPSFVGNVLVSHCGTGATSVLSNVPFMKARLAIFPTPHVPLLVAMLSY